MDIIEFLTIHKTFVVDSIRFWWSQVRFNASCSTESDREKWEYVLLRKTHTIEKGLSLKYPRVGFGQEKVKALLVELSRYQAKYGSQHPQYLSYPLSTIRFWLDYSEGQGVDVSAIRQQWEGVAAQASMRDVVGHAGIRIETCAEIQENAKGDFASLLSSRHSVRYFENKCVDHSLIDQALTMAQQTPSACNRQGWKTHVYEGDACHRLLKWQGGSRGFEEDIHSAIVVTANQKAFLYYEMHQAYVDGGLYAMNLINALHHLGLGTIPLSCGFKQRKLTAMRRLFGILAEEVPVVIIGFGYLPEEVKVAVSERKPITLTNRYH